VIERQPETPRQLPLVLDHRPASAREDLVVGTSNRAAVALIDRWPDWPAPVLVVAGPPGSGKTHLGRAWAEMTGARRLDAASLSPGDAVEAAAGGVFVDDADRPGLNENGLFHLINAVRSAGSTMLLTARRFPGAWGVDLPDLASRLKAAALVEIDEPDDALLSAVIVKLFADRQVEVEAHVVQYLVRRIERSVATAAAIVERLDRAALEEKSRISRALAARVLGAVDSGQREMDL
jgi:chromosomal replication initiation ATPase DnaA